jgi:hypothetical protein
MTRKKVLLSGLFVLCCARLYAQESEARQRLFAAHALYYTPTSSGLKSFHCDAAIDWKAMLTRLTGKDIAEDNPGLQFLRTVHLSVDDELKGKGSMGWENTMPIPPGKEPAMNQTRDGLQTALAGFFQSWNAYMNGSMVPLPDETVKVTEAGQGYHLSGLAKDMKIDEDLDKNLVLTQVLVETPAMRVAATPAYTSTSDGLVISTVTSKINQPPTAPEMEATFRIEYAKVDAFQIPSRIALDIKNTGLIEVGLSNCKVSLADWAKKP